MAKGILLELQDRNAVVLTSQGEFRRVAVPAGNWELGDEVDFPESRALPWQRWSVAVAAAAVLVLSPLGYRSWALAQPVAVVTVDINPSLRLTLNKNEQVLTAEGLNDDGVTLLQGVEWKRRPLGDVVAELTAQAVEVGKLNLADEAGAVVVAVAPAKQEELPQVQADTIATDARKAIQAKVEQQAKAKGVAPVTNVAVFQGSAKEKAAAEAEGLSLGQHLMVQEIHRDQPSTEVTPEQMKKLGPGKLLKELQIKPGPFFNQAEEHHGGKRNDDKPASTGPATPAGKPDELGAKQPGSDDKVQPGNSQGQGKQDDKVQGKVDDKTQGKQDDNGQGKKDGKDDSKKDGKQSDVKLPSLPVEVPKPPVITNPGKSNGGQDDKGDKNGDDRRGRSGSRSDDDQSDDRDSGHRSGDREKEQDKNKDKSDDKGKQDKHP